MVTEVMYHPSPASTTEAAAGYVEGDFEYVEITNISAALTLDLTNVRLTKGVDFDFAKGTIKDLSPGGRVLVVKNVEAFKARYGSGKPVTGAWADSDNLANGGEQLKVSYGAGDGVQDFTYDNVSPWPVEADLGGYSLVLKAPEGRPDHTKATSWRASYVAGGSPGASDSATYAQWAAANNAGAANADDESDGLDNIEEYVLGGTPHASDRGKLPTVGRQAVLVNGSLGNYLTLTYRYALGSEQATRLVEWSSNLVNWDVTGVRLSAVNNGDGTVTEIWRASLPVDSGGAAFGRLRVVVP
jgi:hypothetical protein